MITITGWHFVISCVQSLGQLVTAKDKAGGGAQINLNQRTATLINKVVVNPLVLRSISNSQARGEEVNNIDM